MHRQPNVTFTGRDILLGGTAGVGARLQTVQDAPRIGETGVKGCGQRGEFGDIQMPVRGAVCPTNGTIALRHQTTHGVMGDKALNRVDGKGACAALPTAAPDQDPAKNNQGQASCKQPQLEHAVRHNQPCGQKQPPQSNQQAWALWINGKNRRRNRGGRLHRLGIFAQCKCQNIPQRQSNHPRLSAPEVNSDLTNLRMQAWVEYAQVETRVNCAVKNPSPHVSTSKRR